MKKKIIIKIVVFFISAIITGFFVNKLNNLGLSSVSREMDEPELPLVYCDYDGMAINRMYGYTQTMSTSLMRECVLPVNQEEGVNILVDDISDYGKKYSYQLRSIAGDSLVEEGELKVEKLDNGYQGCNIRFRMDMRENQEYVLVFIIENGAGEKARYYTRVVNIGEHNAKEIIDFAQKFNETSFDKEAELGKENVIYMNIEYKEINYYSNFAHVDLTCTYDMITWADMKPKIITDVTTSITEIDKEYMVVHLSYIISASDGKDTHYYNVDEYYSATYDTNEGAVKLLDFNRYQEAIFDTGYLEKDDNVIGVGVTNEKDLEYVTTDDYQKLAFVKEGQLWYYDYSTSHMISVFSFSQGNYTDVRSMNTNMDINIVNMDDNGEMYFAVYGYMCRGDHEGKNGIALYHFTPSDSKIEEIFFVQVDEPYAIMRQETGRFTYYDKKGHFYYLLDGAIYDVDLRTLEQKVIVSGLSSDKYVVSDNRKVVAYPNNNVKEETTGVIIYNFETGEYTTETGGDSDRFEALGFVGNDLICGVANKSEIMVSSSGEAILPMYKLYIISPDGDILKEYSKSGVYVMDAEVLLDKISLKRGIKRNNFFVETDSDFISYKSHITDTSMVLEKSYHQIFYDEMDFKFPSNIYLSENLNVIMTKTKDEGNGKSMEIKTSTNPSSYYVFDDIGYIGEYASAGSAIIAVNEMGSGLVVDSRGNTVYRGLVADSYNTVADDIYQYSCASVDDTLLTCAFMCIEYIDNRVEYEDVMACTSWADAFDKNTLGVGMNISGIDLSTALYFLDRDVPFAAQIDDGRFVLVISYNEAYVRYYDPILDEEVRILRDEFEEKLSVHGNTMYTYTEQ